MTIYKILCVLGLTILAGCAHVIKPPENINLIYQPSQMQGNNKLNKTVYVEKPQSNNLRMLDDGITYVIGSNNQNQNVLFVTKDSPFDWIAGAIASEFKALGYSVEYVNKLPANCSMGVATKIITFDLKYEANSASQSVLHRSNDPSTRDLIVLTNIDLEFNVITNGTTSKIFNISNGTVLKDRDAAVRDTLSQLIHNAIPVIDNTIKGN